MRGTAIVAAVNRLISELGLQAASDLVDRVVPALTQAYRFNADRHAPEQGDDDRLFGVAVWRTATHELGRRCCDLPDAEILEQDICFEMELAGRTFRVYKMPPRLGDNVDAFALAGSKVKAAQARLNDEQLDLFREGGVTLAEQTEDPTFPRLIILHQGSPLDGLRWIVVGAPSASRGWHWWVKVHDAGWSTGQSTGQGTPGAPHSPKAPELGVRIKPGVLGRTKKDSG